MGEVFNVTNNGVTIYLYALYIINNLFRLISIVCTYLVHFVRRTASHWIWPLDSSSLPCNSSARRNSSRRFPPSPSPSSRRLCRQGLQPWMQLATSYCCASVAAGRCKRRVDCPFWSARPDARRGSRPVSVRPECLKSFWCTHLAADWLLLVEPLLQPLLFRHHCWHRSRLPWRCWRTLNWWRSECCPLNALWQGWKVGTWIRSYLTGFFTLSMFTCHGFLFSRFN